MSEKFPKLENNEEGKDSEIKDDSFVAIDASGKEHTFKIGDEVYGVNDESEILTLKINDINREEKKFSDLSNISFQDWNFEDFFSSRDDAEAKLKEIVKEKSEIETFSNAQEIIKKPSDQELRNQISGTLKNSFKDLEEKTLPKENSGEETAPLPEESPIAEPTKTETGETEKEEKLKTPLEKKPSEEELQPKEITISNEFGLEQNFEEGKEAFYIISRDNKVNSHQIKILDLEKEGFIDEGDVWHPLKYYFSSSEDAASYLSKSKEKSKPVLKKEDKDLTFKDIVEEQKEEGEETENIELKDIFTEEELKETKETLEDIEPLLDNISLEEGEEEIKEEVEEILKKLPEKQRKTLFEGAANAGYFFKENSNWILKNIFSHIKVSNDFLNRHFQATTEAFEKKENEAKNKREKIGKGIMEKTSGWTSVPSAVLRWGRVLNGYGLSNPIRIAMMGAMATGFLAEVEKSARLKNKEVIKKVRVDDDLKRAEEEAFKLNEEAEKLAKEKGKKEASAEDFKEAYEKNLLGDLVERVNRQNISAYYTSLADIRIRRTVFKLNDKFNQIENDKKLEEKQKELEKEKLLKKNAEFLKELDSMVSDFGMVDHLSYYSGLVSKGAKTLTSALTLETLIESVWKNSDHFENAFEFVKEKGEEGAKSIWGKIADFFMKETPVSSDNYSPVPSEKLIQSNVEPEDFEPVQKLSETTEQIPHESAVSEIQRNLSKESDGITGVAEELQMAKQTLSIETPDIFKPAEHLDYQGGKSVWKEAELQLQGRFKELFENLGDDEKSKEALKIYNIDRLKDIVLSNPEKYGLPENPNFRRLSKEMIESIKWDEAFRDAFPKEILTENLSKEAIENIVGTGAPLQKTFSPLEETSESKEIWEESSSHVKEIPAPDNLNLPVVENQEFSPDNPSSENIEKQAEIGEKYGEAPLEQIEVKTEKFVPPSNSAEAMEKLKQSGFQIADENEFIKELGLEKENPEKINETLISLSNLDLDNVKEAKRMIEVSKLSELPLETIDKHIYFALSEDFTPEQSSAVIELLENDKDKKALEFFRIIFRDSKSISAERFMDRMKGESLRIFSTGRNSRSDFELVINKGKFFIEGINIEYPLKDFKSFLKFPSRFITSNLKR